MFNKTIILQGDSTLSSFRQKQLNCQLNEFNYEIVSVKHIYLVNLHDDIIIDIEKIEKLLSAKIVSKHLPGNHIIIGPRIGAISPWSSKATDILNNCGFKAVHRNEHASCFQFNNIVDINIVKDLH